MPHNDKYQGFKAISFEVTIQPLICLTTCKRFSNIYYSRISSGYKQWFNLLPYCLLIRKTKQNIKRDKTYAFDVFPKNA